MQDINRAEDMSLTMYSHGRPRQSPKWFSGLLSYSLILKDKKARPSPCFKADAPAGDGKPDRRSRKPDTKRLS